MSPPDEAQIDLGKNVDALPTIELEKVKLVEVNLKHWNTKSQCISDWPKKDLISLRKFIDKVQTLTPTTVRTDSGLSYKLHKGPPGGRGFSRPSSLARDITLFELRVSGRARVHCYLSNEQLYLVWLDRNHEVFPDG